MAVLIKIPTYTDSRGKLTVVEKLLPFKIKRVYYIYDVINSERGGHRHKKTIQALICINGSCEVYCYDGYKKNNYLLDSPNKCLMVNPQDYHIMRNFSQDAILLVLASEYFEKQDYIDEPYD